MSFSIQTNVNSLIAQENMRMNGDFQGRTIQRLTSGYRINSSSDDAAGLAIANSYRSDVAELQQGVRNANDGISQLQIIDGGLNNISKTLDRLKTLATQSASSTFSGSRATLNDEYSSLLGEITRQASNIKLNSGGQFNSSLNVYLGGGSNSANAQVSIDLSGNQNAVDATSLGIAGTNVLGGGVGLTGNTTRLDAPGATFVVGTAGTDDQTLTFNVFANGTSQAVTAKVAASAGGSSKDQVLSSLNGQLNGYGISASVDNNGQLQFSGGTAFTVKDNGTLAAGTNLISNGGGTASNTSNYTVAGQTTYAGAAQTLKFQTSSGQATVNLLAADSLAGAIAKINQQTSALGVYAVANEAGTGISLQGGSSFSVNASAAGAFAASGFQTSTAPTGGSTSNANAAIVAINKAVQNLGQVQGKVGTGQNRLQYAVQLAQSQISNFSAAESRIRDADVASEAANLTKAQVLQQASLAAAAQANSAPQSILSLLRG